MPEQLDTKTAMELGHSSDVLKKVKALLLEAYDLIQDDKIARKYLNFHSTASWSGWVWKLLDKEYDKYNPNNKDIYFLRAFDYFGLQPGVQVTDGCCESAG